MKGSDPTGKETDPSSITENRRAQLVLVAAGVIALGLVPVALAHLQVGYHPDVGYGVESQSPGRDAVGALDRSVYDAADGIPETHSWDERESAVRTVEERLEPRLDVVRTARIEDGIAYQLVYNESSAARWAEDDCPDGPDRQFGPCEAHGGVVVQERAGATHVLGVAVDVAATTERGTTDLTARVHAVSDR